MAKKKSNIKILGLVFIALLAIVAIMQISKSGKSERSFRSMVIEPDTARVETIEIIDKGNIDNKITIKKEAGKWFVSKDSKKHNADKGTIARLLGSLKQLKTERVAATKKDKWEKFELTDSLATHVILKDGDGKTLSELMIGKFNFKQLPSNNPYQRQPQTKTNTFVRRADEATVYSVDGFLRMNFQPNLNNYRDKKLVGTKPSNISSLTYQYPADSGFSLRKQGGEWMLDGLQADSASCARFVNKLSRMMSGDFVDDPSLKTSETPVYSLKVEGDNFSPVVIQAFPADTTNKLLITSSANEGTWFSGGKNGLWEKIFIPKGELSK